MSLFSKPIRMSERVYIRWDDINYYVPTLKREAENLVDDISRSFKAKFSSSGASQFHAAPMGDIDMYGMSKPVDDIESAIVPDAATG